MTPNIFFQDNWGALKGKMFGRGPSVEGGRGSGDIRVVSESKESIKGGQGGAKKRSEVRGSQKATNCSQPSSERGSTSPRKTRRNQRGPEKSKGEKQGLINIVRI